MIASAKKLFFIILLFINTSSAECPKEYDDKNAVFWESTETYAVSVPLCISKSKTIEYRYCVDGEWGEAPICDSVQRELPRCPEDFMVFGDDYCMMFTEPGTFFPECLFEDEYTFNDILPILTLLGVNNEKPVWLPIRRNWENLTLFHWTESSSLYKSVVDNNPKIFEETEDANKNIDCVVYYNTSYSKAVSCNEKFPRFCVYSQIPSWQHRLCKLESENCRQSHFSPRSKCICWSDNLAIEKPKAEFLEAYQNRIINEFYNISAPCLIGLQMSKNKFIWANSHQEINYTYWASNTTLDKEHQRFVLGYDGWEVYDAEYFIQCIFYENETEMFETPKLLLTYYNDSSTFSIIYENIEGPKWTGIYSPIVYCFTDGSSIDKLMQLTFGSTTTTTLAPTSTSTSTTTPEPISTPTPSNETNNFFDLNNEFLFGPISDYPGNYWCETFSYPENRRIISEIIYYCPQSFNRFFLAVVYFEDIRSFKNRSDVGDLLEIEYLNKLNNKEVINSTFDCPSMRLTNIDLETNEITVNIRVTFNLDPESSLEHPEDRWQKIHSVLENLLNDPTNTNFLLISIKSPDFCGETTSGYYGVTLSWPAVPVNTISFPKEFCFAEGFRYFRQCELNSRQVAELDNMETECEIFKPSSTNLTKHLVEMYEQLMSDGDSMLLYRLSVLSENFTMFDIFDVYLVAAIFQKITFFYKIEEISSIVTTVNNILQIDEKILEESFQKTSASDLLLYSLNEVTKTLRKEHMYASNNFFLIDVKKIFKTSCYLIVKSGYSNILTNEECDFEYFIDLDQLKAAFSFSSSLSEIITNSLTVFKVYSINKLFREVSSKYKFVSDVVDLTFTNCCNFPMIFPIQIVYKLEQKNQSELFCNSWQLNYYDNKRSYWENKGVVSKYEYPWVVCDFKETGSFALMVKSDVTFTTGNVTEDLGNLIEANVTSQEVIKQLENITQRYTEYEEYDVYLSGKVLQKVSNDSDTDLNLVAKIVSNLIQVNRTRLAESQISNKATDLILQSVDEIVNMHVKQELIFNITADKFMVLILNLHKISGVILHQDNTSIKFTVLERNVIFNISNFVDIDSAVIISERLKEQFDDDAKIAITLHTIDALFNEQTATSHVVSKIFGILLPELNEDFKGPLYFYHNLSKHGWRHDCTHWNYNQIANQSGWWKTDSDGIIIEDLLKCEYWHTTHFALLLLPQQVNLPFLDIITTVNCSLSLFGLVAIIFTAICFKRWRMNTGNKILINFTFSIAIQMATLYISYEIKRKKSTDNVLCIIIGVSSHYAIISQCCWMMVIAVLQFRRFVLVLVGPPSYILLKSCIFGWVVPLIPVVGVLFLNRQNYTSAQTGLCYPSGLGLYLGIWLPISIILAINLTIFVLIIYNILHKKTEYVGGSNNSDILLQWRLAILLFFIFGLTWVFGFLGYLQNGTFFIYLFCFSATLQGFVMFLFYIVFNANTRCMYLNMFKMCCCGRFKQKLHCQNQ